MNTQASPKLDSSTVAMRLGMCAAALAGVAAAPAANAVVVTTFANTSVPVPANVDGVYINFLSGGTGTAAFTGWDFNAYLTNAVFSFFWNNTAPSASGGVAATTNGVYLSLNPGDTVSSASLFSASSGGGGAAATAAFQTAGQHILGFRFYNDTTLATNYGYLRVTNTAPSGFPATINGWVYENTGAAITVPVPEPGTGLMLSMGALALGAVHLRRLRRQQGRTSH